jgi:hypothetical protein
MAMAAGLRYKVQRDKFAQGRDRNPFPLYHCTCDRQEKSSMDDLVKRLLSYGAGLRTSLLMTGFMQCINGKLWHASGKLD